MQSLLIWLLVSSIVVVVTVVVVVIIIVITSVVVVVVIVVIVASVLVVLLVLLLIWLVILLVLVELLVLLELLWLELLLRLEGLDIIGIETPCSSVPDLRVLQVLSQLVYVLILARHPDGFRLKWIGLIDDLETRDISTITLGKKIFDASRKGILVVCTRPKSICFFSCSY